MAHPHSVHDFTPSLMSDSPILTEHHAVPTAEAFDVPLNGKPVLLHRLQNCKQMTVYLTNFGARIVSLSVPDSSGKVDDVVLGFNSIHGYLKSKERYFGATIGRVGNRIANGRFKLDGTTYVLDRNHPPNHLHGGVHGFQDAVWDVVQSDGRSVTYRHHTLESVDGYPGNLTVDIRYSITDTNELIIEYTANTDKPTIVNLTNHAYFNLSGADSGSVAKHRITIHADAFTPVTPVMIPTGEILPVDGTPFDFREPVPMGRHWNSMDSQIQIAGGYDHNFVLRKQGGSIPDLAARVEDPVTGRILEVETTEPGVQFYTANALSGQDLGRNGRPYLPRTAFCLETQHYPDTPNQALFPSIRLDPEETFRSTTIYRFLSA